MVSKQHAVLEHAVLDIERSRTVRAFAAFAPAQALQPWTYELEALGTGEIDVAVTHCGVCHTDLHLIDNDLGVSEYPLVPGHEVIGTIAAVGNDVLGLAVGQRVGVGWQRGSCNQCEWCEKVSCICAPVCAPRRSPDTVALLKAFVSVTSSRFQSPNRWIPRLRLPCFARGFPFTRR